MGKKNSRQKGKRGELEAKDYLLGLGFEGARRSQQFCGKAGDSDVTCEALSGLHIEVKRVEGMDVGTLALTQALEQAENDSQGSGKIPVVLWRPNGKRWRLSWRQAETRALLTVAGDEDVRLSLVALNSSTGLGGSE